VHETPWITVSEERPLDDSDPFTVVSRKNFVVVVCRTIRGVVLLDHWRHGAQEWMLELPQGAQEEGETPVEAALRELHEETGWIGEKPQVIGQPLYEAADWATQSFIVVSCWASLGNGAMLKSGELIRRRLEVSPSRLREMVFSGKIRDAATLAALLLGEALEG
jgi:ADP-ribose pyrophosphatase